MSTKFRQAVRFLIWVIRKNVPGRLALLKSSKQRSQLEMLQVSALMQRFPYCRDMISKEGFEKYNKFCEQIYTIYCRTGERAVRKGEQGVRFYMILQGQVSLVSYKPRSRKAQQIMDNEKEVVPNYEDDQLFSPIVFKQLNPGDHFGDMSLLDNGQISCTIICNTFCQFVCMDKQQFVKFIGKSIPLLEKLNVLKEQPIFNSWTDGELRALSYEFKTKTYHAEEYLYKEGEKNNFTYLVMTGQVGMNIMREGQVYHLCTIDFGQIFSDDEDYYTCNAKCTSARVEVFVIGRIVLNRMFDWHPESRQLYKQQLQLKQQWRQERLNELVENQKEKFRIRRNQSVLEMDYMDYMDQKFHKLRQQPCVKRLTNIADILDIEEKKNKHKEVLQKLNKSMGSRKIVFFKLGNNFNEKRRKEQAQQASFYETISKLFSTIPMSSLPQEKHHRASSTMMSKSSTQTKLSPVRKMRKVFSIEGTLMPINFKS